MEEFTQKDYSLYLSYLDKVLVILENELKTIEESGKKTLWFYGAQKTLEHLKEKNGQELIPRDVDVIAHVLSNRIKDKNHEKRF